MRQLLDLCAGIGGFSLGAHWAGEWETAAFCEKDAFCQKVLAKNFPGVPIYDDIFTFPSEAFRGRIDAITAGFPCQPFSAAGKRKGRDDERHIFPKIAEIVGIVRPPICIFENVRGLLSIESGSVFAEVVASLEGEGYEVVTFCVPASAVEAPHRRDRLWIVGCDRRGSARGFLGNAERDGRSTDHGNMGIGGRDHLFGHGQSETKSENGQRFRNEIACANRDATNAERIEGGAGLCEDDRPFGKSTVDSCIPLDAVGSRLQGHELPGTFSEGSWASRPITERFANEHWYEAAARFCRVDDGVSDRVHRLKALGNSIVPQIAFEIFRAIESAEKGEKHRCQKQQ